MATRTRTVTTIGLAARDELLVRSLLKVVNMRTTEAWLFCEDLDADVMLCNPDSALSLMAMKRPGLRGHIRITVTQELATETHDELALRTPIRSNDFIEVLNQASAQLQLASQPHRPPSATEAEEELAHALFRLRLEPDRTHVRINVGSEILVADLKTRRIGSARALSNAELLIIGLERKFNLEIIDGAQGEAAFFQNRFTYPIDLVLWLFGTHSTKAGSPLASADRRYRLRRWPDAGRLPMESFHLRMTAVLMRSAMTAVELAEVVKRTPNDALAYLSSCRMLGLLIEAGDLGATAAPAAPVARASRYSELFQSLRAVLGIRG